MAWRLAHIVRSMPNLVSREAIRRGGSSADGEGAGESTHAKKFTAAQTLTNLPAFKVTLRKSQHTTTLGLRLPTIPIEAMKRLTLNTARNTCWHYPPLHQIGH